MKEIGPVQLLAIGFGSEAKFEGRIMEELAKLENKKTIRMLDLLFVHKDTEAGDLLACADILPEVSPFLPIELFCVEATRVYLPR